MLILDGGEWSASRPAALPPLPIVKEAGWATYPIWRLWRREKYAWPCRESNHGCPARNPVTIYFDEIRTLWTVGLNALKRKTASKYCVISFQMLSNDSITSSYQFWGLCSWVSMQSMQERQYPWRNSNFQPCGPRLKALRQCQKQSAKEKTFETRSRCILTQIWAEFEKH